MHAPLLLALLLGAVSARHLGPSDPPAECAESQAHLSQDLECSGEQGAALAVPPEGAEAEASGSPDGLEDEDMGSQPVPPEGFQCPKQEDTVELQGTPGCKTCRHVLVKTPNTFWGAQLTCTSCYRGRLASIHSLATNNHLRCLTSGINQGQVWIGATNNQWPLCRKFKWTDGSCWNFSNWAPGQPNCGTGRCVALCTRGGQWRRVYCTTYLPFICSI